MSGSGGQEEGIGSLGGEESSRSEREVTVLFCDLVGFRSLADALPIDETYAIVTGCLSLLDEIARRYGAAVDKYLGDALMAVFGAPIPVDDAPSAALLAATEMQNCVASYNREHPGTPPLGLKLGVNTGRVLFGERSGHVLREFHVVGDAVNVAARLKGFAAVGETLVGASTYEQAKSSFGFESRAPHRFKGKSQALRYFALRATGVPEAASPRVFPGADLVGRARELETLQHALRELREGRGGSVAIEGAAGTGKTRLVDDALGGLDAGDLAVHRLQAIRSVGEEPYRLVAELFRSWAGIARDDGPRVALPRLRRAVAEALGGNSEPVLEALSLLLGLRGRERRRANAVDIERGALEALAAIANRGPMVVVCEDLQWADADSIQLLSALIEGAAGLPILFLSTFQPVIGRTTAELLQRVAEGSVDRLRLDPLDAEASRELVARVLAGSEFDEEVIGAILARAGGNPAALVRAAFLTPAIREEIRAAPEVERADESERRRATAVFADLTGFTAMTERLPREAIHELVDECMTVLERVTRRHGGSVEKHLGDCALSFFGAPIAIEDAARAALNASIEMREEIRALGQRRELPSSLDVHIGVETGLAVAGAVRGSPLREFVILGEAVSLASGLSDSAPAGSIYVGPHCFEATRASFDFVRLRPGARGEVGSGGAVYELRSTESALHRQRVPSSLRSELVGRDEELAALRSLVSGLERGTGAVASVWGEAGAGKTRLVSELLETSEAMGVTALAARSLAIGGTLAFHPFTDLLRNWLRISDDAGAEQLEVRLDRELRRLLPSDADELVPLLASLMGRRGAAEARVELGTLESESIQRRILRAIALLLEGMARERPLVLVFEDLHWADVSSIELLEALLRLSEEAPVLLVHVFRPGFVSTSGQILEAVRGREKLSHLELPLRPLDDAAVARLVENLFGRAAIPARVRRTILEKAEGNPFYVEEVVRSLLDRGVVEVRDGELRAAQGLEETDIPDTIHEVVMSRIDTRPLRQRQLLQVASVVGQSFHIEVLADVLGDEEELRSDLADLQDAGFLAPLDRFAGAELGFAHPLMQAVAYDTIVAERRASTHGEVARAVEARLTEDVPGYHGMLAYHYVQAHETERAEDLLFRAGDEAAQVAASAEALHFFREALRLFYELHGEDGARDKRALLEKKIATALHHRGQFLEAVDHYNHALTLRGVRVPRTTPAVLGRFAWNISAVLLHLYVPRPRRVRKKATPGEREIIELMFDRAQAQTTTSPTRFLFDGMDNLARLQRVDPASVPEAGRMYAGVVGIFAYGGVSFETSRRFLELAEPLVAKDDPGQRMMFHCMNFCHHLLQGDWSDTREAPEALLDRALEVGRLWEATTYLGLRMEKDIYQGRFERARESLERMTRVWDLYQYDLAKTNVHYSSALLRMQSGELPEALEAIQVYYDEIDEDLLNVLAMGAKSKLQIQSGDLEGASVSLAMGDRLAERSRPVPPFHLSSLLRSHFLHDLVVWEKGLAESARGVGKMRRRARASGRRAFRAAEKVAWRRTEALRLLGRFHWLDGNRPKALDVWQRSIDTSQELGARPELARTYAELARRLAEPGERLTLGGRDASAFRDDALSIFDELGIRETVLEPGMIA